MTPVTDLQEKFAQTIVHFEFGIGDAVVVRGTGIDGWVQALLKDQDGEQYQVAYWYNGNRFVTWVFAREITQKPK